MEQNNKSVFETQKLEVTADNINEAVKRYNKSISIKEHVTNIPFWYRIAKYVNNIGISGRVTFQFAWYNAHNGTSTGIFAGNNHDANYKADIKDYRVTKYRVVYNPNSDTDISFIDFLVSPVENDIFNINTNLFNVGDSSASVYAGNIDSDIPDGYVVIEKDIV